MVQHSKGYVCYVIEAQGGQILRCAVSVATITKQAIHIRSIRAGRPKPGLRYVLFYLIKIWSNQHLAGILLASKICDGKLLRCSFGSCDLEFYPNQIKHGLYEADALTAGYTCSRFIFNFSSVSLILQTVIPILAFGRNDSELQIIGGTDVQFAPLVDYLRTVRF